MATGDGLRSNPSRESRNTASDFFLQKYMLQTLPGYRDYYLANWPMTKRMLIGSLSGLKFIRLPLILPIKITLSNFIRKMNYSNMYRCV